MVTGGDLPLAASTGIDEDWWCGAVLSPEPVMTNAEPIGPRGPQPGIKDWLHDNSSLLAIIGFQLLFFATLMATMNARFSEVNARFSEVNSGFSDLRSQIQASDTNRQADTRAVNGRMDNLQTQVSSHSHP